MQVMSNKKDIDNFTEMVLYEMVNSALFEISPDEWNPVSVSDCTYPMAPEGKVTQAYLHRGDVADVMLYRTDDGKSFKIDIYQRMQFDGVRELFKSRKKNTSKTKFYEALGKVVDSELKEAAKRFPGCVVFFSADLLEPIKKIKGMKAHPDRPSEEINPAIIAAAPIYLYKKHTFIVISKTMMDVDYTPNDMYVLVPLFSFVANRKDDNGNPNKMYELIREIYAEAIIVNSEGWADSAIENGMCGSIAKMEQEKENDEIEDWMGSNGEESEKPNGLPMDTTPVKLGDDFHWGEQENGDILFTKEQMEGIDFDFKSIIRMTSARQWGIFIPQKNFFPELLGLDYNIAHESGNSVYVISMMRDYDGGRFYVFSTFVDGKKTGGKIFYEKDFANYTLCKYRMNTVMQMFLSSKKMLDSKPKARRRSKQMKRTSSRNARTCKEKKS